MSDDFPNASPVSAPPANFNAFEAASSVNNEMRLDIDVVLNQTEEDISKKAAEVKESFPILEQADFDKMDKAYREVKENATMDSATIGNRSNTNTSSNNNIYSTAWTGFTGFSGPIAGSAKQDSLKDSNDTRTGNPYGITRSAWLIYTDISKNELYLYPNPLDYTLTPKLRGVQNDIRGGTTLAYWWNPITKMYMNNPVLSVTMQTGSIMPTSSAKVTGMPYGLYTMHRLFYLIYEENKITDEGKTNFVNILIKSYMFPYGLLVRGQFDPEGTNIPIKEDAEDPFRRIYTFDIIVHDTTPRLTNLSDIQSKYKQFLANNSAAKTT